MSGAKSPYLFLVVSLFRFLVHCWGSGGEGSGRGWVRGVPFLTSSQWSASMFHSWFEWQIWPSDKLKSHFWFRGQLKIYANAVTQKVMTDPLQSRLIETYIYLLRGCTRSLGLVAWVQTSSISFHAEICPHSNLKRMELSKLNAWKEITRGPRIKQNQERTKKDIS